MNEEVAKKVSRSDYHVVVFGDPEREPEDTRTSNFPGQVEIFPTKVELTKWVRENMAKEHQNQELADACMIQLFDGRTAMVIKGVAKGLRLEVFVR